MCLKGRDADKAALVRRATPPDSQSQAGSQLFASENPTKHLLWATPCINSLFTRGRKRDQQGSVLYFGVFLNVFSYYSTIRTEQSHFYI